MEVEMSANNTKEGDLFLLMQKRIDELEERLNESYKTNAELMRKLNCRGILNDSESEEEFKGTSLHQEEYPELNSMKASKNKRVAKNAPIIPTQKKAKISATTIKASDPKSDDKAKQKNMETVRRPPAIIAYYKNHKSLQEILKRSLGNNNTTLHIRQETVKIECVNKVDFIATKEVLEKHKINFYSFTPRDEKPFTMVLKNVSTTYEAVEIQEAILEKIPQIDIIQVKHMTRNNWIVQVKNKDSLSELRRLKSILGFGIRIEKYKSTKQIMQCKNCQRFNHLSTNCKMPFRCVKCGENHGPGNCTIPDKDHNNEVTVVESKDGSKKTVVGKPLKCVNCGQQHAASYTKCTYRTRIEQQRAPKFVQIKRNVIPTNFRQNNISYSSMAAHSTKQTTVNKQPEIDINEEINNLFGKDINTCVNKIKKFIPKYKNLGIDERPQALVKLLFELCLD